MGGPGRLRLSNPLRMALLAAACGVALFGAGTAASAHPLTTPGDPPGANGTVKIDDIPVDGSVRNEPHVGCAFAVKFFNFDTNETADIEFAAQPPTGTEVLLTRRHVTISKDSTGGARNDPDEVFRFTADDLGLTRFDPHPQQGYHVKLTVTLDKTGTPKHKVFWVGPCGSVSSPSPSVSPSEGGGSNGGSTPGGSGGGSGGSGLPITGPQAGVLAGVGAALLGGGAALVLIRRRRRIAFTTGE